MKPEQWIVSGDTGMSSITIWAVMTGVMTERPSIPYDPADFGRCYRLLALFPEWKARLNEVAKHYPAWKALVDAWDQMEALYVRDVETGRCDELYALMQKLQKVRS